MAACVTIAAASLRGAGSTVPAVYIPALPAGAAPLALGRGPAGNLFVAGALQPQGAASTAQHAFAAELSPDGQTLVYFKLLAGSNTDRATALAVDAAGNVYVAGGTGSADFPVTPGVLETSLNGALSAGFVVKLDPSGNVVYSTLFGGGAYESTTIRGIAIDAAGEVFLTGQTVGGNFSTTPGPVQPYDPENTFFTSRISAAGDRLIYSVVGLGGYAIGLDSGGNAYIQGASFNTFGQDVPVTAGAFQTTVNQAVVCGANMAFEFPCSHQYAAKLDPTGTMLLFCTFVSGSSADEPAGIAVDSNGDVYLAGTTDSTDYPVTAGAAQMANIVILPPNPINWSFIADGEYIAFPSTGYVTKLSGDGSHLIYSTYLGGSQADTATGLAIDSAGQAYVSMDVQSPDFPGLPAAPPGCLPNRLRDFPAIAALDADGDGVTSVTIIEGAAPGAAQHGLVLDGQGGAELLTDGPYFADTRAAPGAVSSAADPIVCLTDSFDFTSAGTISPGQLVSIFGNSLGPAAPVSYDPQAPALPLMLGGASLLVGGVAAPLLYVSEGQINFVVPYEVSGQAAATLQLTSAGGASSRTTAVAALTPSLATLGVTAYPVCQGGTLAGSVSAMVLNQDGTQNSCTNPAAAGSVIRVFLNGAGISLWGGTGVIAQSPMPLNEFVSAVDLNVEQTVAIPGAPLGSWEVDIRLNAVAYPYYAAVQLTVGGVAVRESQVAVWIAP